METNATGMTMRIKMTEISCKPTFHMGKESDQYDRKNFEVRRFSFHSRLIYREVEIQLGKLCKTREEILRKFWGETNETHIMKE
jgi:hypothetical protein